jgi:predicted O-methyltransferase YrrM
LDYFNMRNHLFDPALSEYLSTLIPARPEEMQKMEAYARETSFPIIGPVAGYFCYTIARMVGAKRVFELGSGYGYSTAWFAKAVRDNGGGEVYHVVWDETLSQRANEHLNALGFNDIVRYRVGEAVDTLRAETGPYDLIFSDIDKEGYPDSLAVIEEKIRPYGVLIVDNLLMSGRVYDEQEKSASVKGVRKFTQMIQSDPSWVTSIIPIRDGLMLAVRDGP